jgi:hypothetical protein
VIGRLRCRHSIPHRGLFVGQLRRQLYT